MGRTEKQGWRTWDAEPPSGGGLGGVSRWERLTHALLRFTSAHGKEDGVKKPNHEPFPASPNGSLPVYPNALVPCHDPLWDPLGAQAGHSLTASAPQPHPRAEPRGRAGPNPMNPEPGPGPHMALPVRCCLGWHRRDPSGTGSGSGRPHAPPAGPGRHREKPKRRCQIQAEQTRPGPGGCGCPRAGLEGWREGGGESQGRGSSGARRLWAHG